MIKKCKLCNKEFRISTYYITKVNKRCSQPFCSMKCRVKNTESKQPNIYCNICNKKLTRKQLYGKKKLTVKKYCSIKCFRKGQKKRYKKFCIVCNKPFYIIKSSKKKMCSHSCASKYNIKKMYDNGFEIWNKNKKMNKKYRNMCRDRQNKLWNDKKYRKKQMRKIVKTPNQTEQCVLKILKKIDNKWKFVGDGKFFIETRCPDFLHENKKLIIEVFGSCWHKPKEEQEKIDLYRKYGYKTKIIWIEGITPVKSKEKRKKIEKDIRGWLNGL